MIYAITANLMDIMLPVMKHDGYTASRQLLFPIFGGSMRYPAEETAKKHARILQQAPFCFVIAGFLA